ncbi:hypothetical protein JHK87_001281 [Glycine soja]|nr:hypothetical protein JHK87_001281 [Glycine soja]
MPISQITQLFTNTASLWKNLSPSVGPTLLDNVPTANTIITTEHGITLLATMVRNVSQVDASTKASNFHLCFFLIHVAREELLRPDGNFAGKWKRSQYVGVSMVGKTLAVMGFGKVRSKVARRAKGLVMHMIDHDLYAPSDSACAFGVDLVSFDQAIATADFISLYMPLTPTTNKIFNDNTFAKMNKGVCIINVAREGVIDEDALVRALDSGTIAQFQMEKFTKKIVDMMKAERLFESQDGPIILSQVDYIYNYPCAKSNRLLYIFK